MIRSDQHSGREVGLGTQAIVWLGLMAVAAGNFGLAYVPLGPLQLPVAIGLGAVNAAAIAWWFMHLAEHRGTRRFALPVGIGFLLLLLGIVLLDVATRFPPANPNAVAKEPQPRRPLPSRTEPPGGPIPLRLPGQ